MSKSFNEESTYDKRLFKLDRELLTLINDNIKLVTKKICDIYDGLTCNSYIDLLCDINKYLDLYFNDHDRISNIMKVLNKYWVSFISIQIYPNILFRILPLYSDDIDKQANEFFNMICNKIDIVKYYLQNYNIDRYNKYWFFTIYGNYFEITKYLLENDFKINNEDLVSRNSELHDIIKFPKKYGTNIGFVKLLVDYGANLECKNNADQTPYELLLSKEDLHLSDNFLEIKNYLENIISN